MTTDTLTRTFSDTDLLGLASTWQEAGHGVALARVLTTWGSAPRPVGSVMVIRNDGRFEGSISGGCVEGEVITQAQSVIASGKPERLTYGVSNTQAWEVGLACGGKIAILVEPVTQRLSVQLQHICHTMAHRHACALVTDLDTAISDLYLPQKDAVSHDVAACLIENRSRLIEEETPFFVHVFHPAIRLFVVGAVHITQALADIAAILDIDVTVIDPRTAFANAERFPKLTLDDRWPDDALQDAHLDDRSAVVTLTHDPKLDDAALQIALSSPAFYIGSLGSKKTHAARLKRLEKAGFTKEVLSRIHGPVGLDIGSKSPAEIATSIVAELVSLLRHGS